MAGPERVNLDELAFWAQRQPQSASMEAAAVKRSFLGQSISEETRRGYETGRRAYLTMGFSYPTSADQIIAFVRGLTEVTSLAPSSIRKYVTAVRVLGVIDGHKDITTDDEKLVARAFQAMDRHRAPVAKKPKQAVIIDEEVIKALAEYPPDRLREHAVAHAAVLTGVALALRPSELLRIKGEDILVTALHGSGGVEVRINLGVTKTRRLEEMLVSCPLAAEQCRVENLWCVAHFLKNEKEKTPPVLKVFRSLRRGFSKAVRKLAEILPRGVSAQAVENLLKFTGYSCRRSSATFQRRAGVSERSMMHHCRWKTAAMVETYTREQQSLEGRTTAAVIMKHVSGAK